MTQQIGGASAAKTIALIVGPKGVNAGLAALTQPANQPRATPLDAAQVRAQNVAADLAERGGAQYPAVNVYCEKVVNSLVEKFRSFSGSVQMAVEIRHSQDRLDGLQDQLEVYADAATQALDGARGDWGDGMFYAGGYQVAFGGAKQGGKNFIQTAKITFEIGVSRN
ncbi:MAG: hypothetical protein ABSC23_08705 [Bryobacteraceae bacterium]